MTNNLFEKSERYLNLLCHEIKERCVGSSGNIMATDFLEKELIGMGWNTGKTVFDAIDWEENGAILRSDNSFFDVLVSPYSLSFPEKPGWSQQQQSRNLKILISKIKYSCFQVI